MLSFHAAGSMASHLARAATHPSVTSMAVQAIAARGLSTGLAASRRGLPASPTMPNPAVFASTLSTTTMTSTLAAARYSFPHLRATPSATLATTTIHHHPVQHAIEPFGPDDPIVRLHSWSAMPADVRTAWATLGWSKESWLQGPCPESEFKEWDALSDDQRKAAERVRYTEDLWNAEDVSEDSLFHLKESLIPSEIVFGAVFLIVAGWTYFYSGLFDMVKHQECEDCFDETHDHHYEY